MKIKLTNKTAYRDEDLRAIVKLACGRAGLPHTMTLFLAVTQARTRGTSGYAYLGHRVTLRRGRMRLCISAPGTVSVEEVARLALHEAMHVAGVEHKDMTEEQYNCTMPVSWAAELQLRAKDIEPIEERRAAARTNRLEHAQAMLAKAVTRRKRAATIEKKWSRRVKMMERA